MSIPLIVMPQNQNLLFLVNNNAVKLPVNDHNYNINNNTNNNINNIIEQIEKMKKKTDSLEHQLIQFKLLFQSIEDKFKSFIQQCICQSFNHDIIKEDIIKLFDKYKDIRDKSQENTVNNDLETEVIDITQDNDKPDNHLNEEIVIANEIEENVEKSTEIDKNIEKSEEIEENIAKNKKVKCNKDVKNSESLPLIANNIVILPVINRNPVLNSINESPLNQYRNKVNFNFDYLPEEPLTYKCQFKGCTEVFTTKKKRWTHSQKHSKQNISCTYLYCKKKFISEESFTKHYNKHLGIETNDVKKKSYYKTEKKYKCDWDGCEMMFTQPSGVKKHYNEYHLKIEKFFCIIPGCSQGFVHKNSLDRHIGNDHGFKFYKCSADGCKESFWSRGLLARHHSCMHTKVKKFKCDECDDCFNTKNKLNSHKSRKHNALKPYACDWPECQFKTTINTCLTQHKRRHTGEKPFECQWSGCESSFRQRTALITHMRIHTGHKPYKCQQYGCDQAFRYSNDLKNHKNRFH